MCPPNFLAKLCRLCSMEIEYGFDIFVESEVKASLVILINKYLPIKVAEDDTLPKQICESCHIGVAATVDLIDRMVEGQHRLRKLHHSYITKINKNTKHLQAVTEDSEQTNTKDCGNLNSDSLILQNKLNDIKSNSSYQLNDNLLQNNIKFLTDCNYMIPQKSNDCQVKIEPETTLINIQGDSPAIEMNDLAKGTEVKKVYESHPLGLVVEGINPKRRRGRPRKEAGKGKKSRPKHTDQASNEVDSRPKRNRNLPSRFRDLLAGKEFDKLLMNDPPFNDLNITGDPLQVEEGGLLEGEYSFGTKTKTHTLEGITVVVTQNHPDEGYEKLPEAVNIQLDFNDTTFPTEVMDDTGISKFSHTPKASVLAVRESSILNVPEELHRYLKPEKKRRGPRRKFKYSCEYCGKEFQHIGRYWFHIKNHKTVILQCDECKSRFSNTEDVMLHQQSSAHKGLGVIELENDDNMSIKCPLCQCRSFLTLEKYRAHVASMHEGHKPFACAVCGKRFAYKHSLKTHHFIHQPEENKKRYQCKDCNKEFYHQSSLHYHRDTRHNSDTKFVCVFCTASFKHKQLLQRHLVVHSDNRPYVCKLCGSSFKTKGNLYNHMNIHTKSKIYTCGICSKKFGHPTSLHLHLRSHTGEKPFTCTYCGKSFSQNGNLQEHVRIHTGLKPYCCSYCAKKFTTSSQLCLHEKRHRSDYKFTCAICLKGFFSIEALRIHDQKHKNISTTFSCEHCSKAFVSKSQLTKHMKSHSSTGDKYDTPVECKTCNKVFSDEFAMVKHLEEHQLEKTWFINQATHPVASTMPSASQDVIYVIPKKEEQNQEFLPFITDEIFEDQEREQLPSVNSITNISTNFTLSQNNGRIEGSDGKIFSLQNPSQASEASFEISLKESEQLPFEISVCEGNTLYVRRVFDE